MSDDYPTSALPTLREQWDRAVPYLTMWAAMRMAQAMKPEDLRDWVNFVLKTERARRQKEETARE